MPLADPAKRILTAAEKNVMTIVQSLVTQQPSLVNSRDNDQYTPLHRASYNNHAEMVEVQTFRTEFTNNNNNINTNDNDNDNDNN